MDAGILVGSGLQGPASCGAAEVFLAFWLWLPTCAVIALSLLKFLNGPMALPVSSLNLVFLDPHVSGWKLTVVTSS